MKYRAVDLISKKRNGGELTPDEINQLIGSYLSGETPDYQMSAWLMAACLRGLTTGETVALTKNYVDSGDRVDLTGLGRVVDKHSTGGVGDKATLIVAPLAAACGVPIAKLSGRGLGHTGGTLDKLEAIPGMRIDLSLSELKDQVEKIGIAVAGQTGELVPADKRIYALRDVTGTVSSEGLIAASVMSKKIAGGANALVLDVKVGSGALLKDVDEATELASLMIDIGEASGIRTTALLTSMDDVLGRAVGNAIEVTEAIEVLKGEGPPDLIEVCEALAAEMVFLGRAAATRDGALAWVRKVRLNGEGLERFRMWLRAQGGDARIVEDSTLLPAARHERAFLGWAAGRVASVDCEAIGRAAGILGAGRSQASDTIDPGAGIVVNKKLGDFIEKGELLASLLSGSPQKLDPASELLRDAWIIEPVSSALSPAFQAAAAQSPILGRLPR